MLYVCFVDIVVLGIVILEGLWLNSVFEGGKGINMFIGVDLVVFYGGVVFYDIVVWIRVVQVCFWLI